jgi:hypothetical protein
MRNAADLTWADQVSVFNSRLRANVHNHVEGVQHVPAVFLSLR